MLYNAELTIQQNTTVTMKDIEISSIIIKAKFHQTYLVSVNGKLFSSL